MLVKTLHVKSPTDSGIQSAALSLAFDCQHGFPRAAHGRVVATIGQFQKILIIVASISCACCRDLQ